MYSLSDYGRILGDKERGDAYRRALKKVITPETIVLEIGTGTGMFALEACRCGARRVYAVEIDNVIHYARQVAEENGYGDRIVFIQEDSTKVELPEKADVIFSDLRGKLPLFNRHVSVIMDARRRFLAPGGTLIPQRDKLMAAISSAPVLYDAYRDSWIPPESGLHAEVLQDAITNNIWWDAAAAEETLITDPVLWFTLNYRVLETQDAEGGASWRISQPGTAHGIRVWFDAELLDDIGFSNRPGAGDRIYGNVFFPWPQPVSLQVGDSVTVAFTAKLMDDDYVWRWNSTIVPAGRNAREKISFRQSTFSGTPPSLTEMRKAAADFRPALNEDGRIKYQILALMNDGLQLNEIAQKIQDTFPGRFRNKAEALRLVSRTSIKYSK